MNVLSALNVVPTILAQAAGSARDVPADDRGLLMSIIVWLFVGLVAGFLASKIVNKRGEGIFLDIILGLVGSMVGGFLFHLVGFHRDGSIILSILVATVGAILVLVIYHKVVRGRRAV